MIVTRKIQVVIDSEKAAKAGKTPSELKACLFSWERSLRSAANMIVSHKFVQQNMKDFFYIKDDYINRFLYDEETFELSTDERGKPRHESLFISDLLKEEPGCSEQNVTYKVISSMLKNLDVPGDFRSNLNQIVSKNYKEKMPDFLRGKATIPSYSNIPIPFPAKKLESGLKQIQTSKTVSESGAIQTKWRYFIDFYGIPLFLNFGKDRSNNRAFIERALAGEYRFRTSSLSLGRQDGKMFFNICFDIPTKQQELNPSKVLYARLSPDTPIVCSTKPQFSESSAFKIGSKEEYLHRRLQIQQGFRRAQMNSKYTVGGHGRKKKMAAVERFRKAEINYVVTKTHVYSKELVRKALQLKCGRIILLDYHEQTDGLSRADNEHSKFIIRNWSYYDLRKKIEYKAKMNGIVVEVLGEGETNKRNR